ncbi:LUD domain-containing protein [Halospeciosus flavus]|uniref:LUD domain-containing protein n=1 Tax=Halospeciosus flavus TaxID=3032283 RepID=A0ABD5Z0L0_9EURY|nr:LUD domain-containing protein [Halospeciosus flavus]
MSEARREKAEHIRHLLDSEGASVKENARHFNAQRYEATEDFEEYQDLRTEARRIKEDAIENLPELIDTLRESVEENGGNLYLADDAADANRYIEEVVEEEDAETLVKSKSMTTEEIEVNEHLEAVGVDVYETDLGEFVLQVADEAPSHLVGPAIHKSKAEIAVLFNEYFDIEDPLKSAEELTKFARDYLGEKIHEADVGMTGANFVLAESGTITLVTNEGNARKSAVTPDTHVAVAGVEKVIPSVRELHPFIELIAKSATGQDIAQYVSLLSPPTDSPTLDFDDPDVPDFGEDSEREFHLVLIDNGRMAMREDEQLKETLYCIRCGACANTCGNFQSVGGHAFGGETYTGGIATGWEAGVHGLDSAAEFNDLCTGCSRCAEACPVKIDIPWINTAVRSRINEGADTGRFDHLVDGLLPDGEPSGLDLQKRFFGNFETLAKLGSATAPVSNWVANAGPVRSLLERAVGVDRRRDLPEFQRETFADWFRERGGPRVPRADAPRSAVLFPDAYTNYVRPARGKAAVRALEALGVHVTLSEPAESGRAPFSQGMLSTAETQAEAVADDLGPYVQAAYDVVVVEPSDVAMFRSEYEKLLSEDLAEPLREHSYEVMEYVYGCLENGADADALRTPDDSLAFHGHCQQRTLGLDAYTEAVFDVLDCDVVSSDTECCGMAGSFGYKSEYYELSMDVGEDLQAQFEDETDRRLVASGTSCCEQLDALLDRPADHPVEAIAPSPE